MEGLVLTSMFDLAEAPSPPSYKYERKPFRALILSADEYYPRI